MSTLLARPRKNNVYELNQLRRSMLNWKKYLNVSWFVLYLSFLLLGILSITLKFNLDNLWVKITWVTFFFLWGLSWVPITILTLIYLGSEQCMRSIAHQNAKKDNISNLFYPRRHSEEENLQIQSYINEKIETIRNSPKTYIYLLCSCVSIGISLVVIGYFLSEKPIAAIMEIATLIPLFILIIQSVLELLNHRMINFYLNLLRRYQFRLRRIRENR